MTTTLTPAEVLDAGRERPILFSAPMVRAILAGTKTQTRRIVKPQPEYEDAAGLCWRGVAYGITTERRPYLGEFVKRCPYGAPGDRLWVREAFTHITGNGIRVHYRADGEPTDREGRVLPTEPGLRRWSPSIHMPRRASRITLEVTRVRVERLHDITEEDARAEGVEAMDGMFDEVELCRIAKIAGSSYEDARGWFAALWCQINGAESWDANPWVWVVEFKRMEAAARLREAK